MFLFRYHAAPSTYNVAHVYDSIRSHYEETENNQISETALDFHSRGVQNDTEDTRDVEFQEPHHYIETI